MKTLRLKETYTQYTVSRNVYGDEILTQIGSGLCLFRDIQNLGQTNNFEGIQVDGIFWFASSDAKNMGDVVGIYGNLYRIAQVTIARERITSNSIHFYKCTATLLRQVS